MVTPCVQYVAASEAAVRVWHDPCGQVKDVPRSLAEGGERMAAATVAVTTVLLSLQHGGLPPVGVVSAAAGVWWQQPQAPPGVACLCMARGLGHMAGASGHGRRPSHNQPPLLVGCSSAHVCVCGGEKGLWGWQAHSNAPFLPAAAAAAACGWSRPQAHA